MGVVWDGLALGTLDDVLFIRHIIKNSLRGSHLLFLVSCTAIYGRNTVYRYLCYIWMYPILYYISGEAWIDGCVWMVLDDTSLVVILSYLALSYPEYFTLPHLFQVDSTGLQVNLVVAQPNYCP